MSEPMALFGRWCPCCCTVKPEWAFYTSRQTYCKECVKAKARDYIARNPEKVKERDMRNWEELKADPLAYAAYLEKRRNSRKNPEYRERQSAYQRKYYEQRKAKKSNGSEPADVARD